MTNELLNGAEAPRRRELARLELLHGVVRTRLGWKLLQHVEPRRAGTVVVGGTAFRLRDNPETVRVADIAYFDRECGRVDMWEEGYPKVAPDLVVEVAAGPRGGESMDARAMEWLKYGVRMVWWVDPFARSVEVYRDDWYICTRGEGEELEGYSVLPLFVCRVEELFEECPQPPVRGGYCDYLW